MSDKQNVCVTGAGGYLASWLVKLLLSNNYIVHGTVRDPCDEKNAHLKELENAQTNLKLFKTDLLDPQGLCAAIEGCVGVFHVASLLPPPGQPTLKEELMEAAVIGTQNVLTACSKAKVKKIVVVSSVAAIVMNPSWPKDRVMDEESWSDVELCENIKKWYFLSKTAAEKEAWDYAKRHGLHMITVCPSLIIGPLLQSTMNATSLHLLQLLRDGSESVDNGLIPYIDVRDAAESLLIVYENPEAEGRYICSSHEMRTEELINKLKLMYPHFNYPKSYCGERMAVRLSSKKLQDLGWKYRPFDETLVDVVTNYQQIGVLQ
ncbi:cinnamoyl-CoA reductase 2-like [Mercurialis annua]|uniref:cinnamoyl-CoA reductase 2-like n=1 Tax=Mercurialis annua TaxID=3986 RepID=UPI0021603274|nr:cinnamoyl-CoA reductase 2-like [Mercurialis annua]XP_055960366.1 cinnamoyl-CoA reductase 2-like [Mercurialis annua]